MEKTNYPVREKLGSDFWVTVFPVVMGWEWLTHFLLLLPLSPPCGGGWGPKAQEIWSCALVMLKYWLQVMMVK